MTIACGIAVAEILVHHLIAAAEVVAFQRTWIAFLLSPGYAQNGAKNNEKQPHGVLEVDGY